MKQRTLSKLFTIAAVTVLGAYALGQEVAISTSQNGEPVRLKLSADQAIAADKMKAEMRFGLAGKIVKNQPYSAEATTETTQTLGDGTHIHNQSSYTIYRDSEGRVRRETPTEIWISDPVANESYVLTPAKQIARKIPLMRTFINARVAPKTSAGEAADNAKEDAVKS